MTISGLIGGLVPTALITLLLATLFERLWDDRLWTVLLANGLSAVICVLLARYGYDDLNKALGYLIPQAIVLVITVLRWRGRERVA
jgi:chromate transport protein ChrA